MGFPEFDILSKARVEQTQHRSSVRMFHSMHHLLFVAVKVMLSKVDPTQ